MYCNNLYYIFNNSKQTLTNTKTKSILVITIFMFLLKTNED